MPAEVIPIDSSRRRRQQQQPQPPPAPSARASILDISNDLQILAHARPAIVEVFAEMARRAAQPYRRSFQRR